MNMNSASKSVLVSTFRGVLEVKWLKVRNSPYNNLIHNTNYDVRLLNILFYLSVDVFEHIKVS